MKQRLAFLLLACCFVFRVQGQQANANKTSPRIHTEFERLAKPVEWGQFPPVHMFKDSHVDMTFTLTTSWIPGEDHKGMFRYKLIAVPNLPKRKTDGAALDPELDTPEKSERFLTRVAQCDVFLGIHDSDGFLLRKILVPLGKVVNDEVQVTELYANTAVQMDAEEYRMFLGNANASGAWNISWNCPE